MVNLYIFLIINMLNFEFFNTHLFIQNFWTNFDGIKKIVIGLNILVIKIVKISFYFYIYLCSFKDKFLISISLGSLSYNSLWFLYTFGGM